MAIKLAIAQADRAWCDSVRARPGLAEINFWTPAPRPFATLQAGELLLFACDGAIAGGGVFLGSAPLPASLAWEIFAEANGAGSLPELRALIEAPRAKIPRRDAVIACHILAQPFFWDDAAGFSAPPSFGAAARGFKTYDTAKPDGAWLWDAVQQRLAVPQLSDGEFFDEQRRYGNPVLVRPRLGQGAFRVLVTEAYRRRCAVTAEKTLPALDAAHIRPYAQGGEHRLDNGILLRRDIHALFDLGYVAIAPDLTFLVSRRIREEYDNGRAYYALHGTAVAQPHGAADRPDPAALAWHRDSVFLGV